MPKREDGSRRSLSKEQCAQLNLFIKTKHNEGRQVFQRTVGEWMEQQCGRSMSNRSVGRLLQRLGYVRRCGRIKIPPLTEPRKARIRRFLIEMNDALAQENEVRAIIVYMDENFVHQLHASAYSYFERDNKGVVHGGFGRTSGKGQRMIMVHAITKHGPLVTRDGDGFPIPEGPFKPKADGRGREGPGNLCEVPTAEFLWQAKHAKGDYHAAMTDKMFMDWIKMRLTPAFEKKFGKDKKKILILDNATYHHGYNEEVKVPESNSKTYNTSLLQNHGVKRIRVERAGDNCQGRSLITTHNFEVPEPGGSFPRARSACGNGVSKEEVALATRTYFQVHHPEKLLEKVEAYVKEKGWELI